MKTQSENIDVVIPVYNNWSVLRNLLVPIHEWLEVQSNVNVIIVDDGSQEQCEELLYRLMELPQVTVISHVRNQGRASARNTGYQAGDSDYVAFLDVDCIPDKNWLAIFSDQISRGSDFVSGNLRSKGEGYWSRYLNELYDCKAKEYLNGSTDFSTPFCMFRRCILDGIGGFSENYKKYGFEDRDLIQRALETYQLRSTFLCDVYAYHVAPSDIGSVLKKSVDSGYSSSKIFSIRFPDFYRKTAYWYFDARKHSYFYCAPLVISACAYNRMFFVINRIISGEMVPYVLWKFLVKVGSALAFFWGSYKYKVNIDHD